MSKLGKITRRTFLLGSVAIAGGVAFGYWKYKQPYGNPLLDGLKEGETALTPYILINADGVTVIAPRAEMGQGIHTTLAAMVAEELDVTLSAIKVIHGPASKAYYNAVLLEEAIPIAQTDTGGKAQRLRHITHIPSKFLGMQITGGSSSVPDGFDKMRIAGAAAKQVLIQAAAEKYQLDPASLTTENGQVLAPNGDRIPYTELADIAATIEPPANPELKPRSAWTLLGKSQPRVDVVPKATGTAEFGIDVQLPGLLYASVRANPRLGAGIKRYDATQAETMPGVKRIVPLDKAVAVVATNTWYAMKAVNAIDCDWEEASYAPDSKALMDSVLSSFNDDHKNSRFLDEGDVDQVLAASLDEGEQAVRLQGEYQVPYLAHAAMEPMNATAWLRDGQIDIWVGNQLPTQVAKEAATLTGLAEDRIHVHTPYMGGGFGRRAEMDYIIQAIDIARQMEGTPVKLTWTREEDTTHDAYRPMAAARFQAQVDDSGPVALDLQLAAPSVAESQFGRLGVPLAGPDFTIVQSAWDQPYGVPNYRVTGYKVPEALPVSSWRSVGASQNGFFHESILDELAHAKGLDPMAMRLNMMTHKPSRQVLEKVAEMSNWGAPMPEGQGRGVAFVLSFGVPSAEVIEVALENGAIRILKAYAAVDVGLALDPRNIEAQVMSGLNFGLAAAMMGDITVKDGQVEQTNFHNYSSIRMNQAPDIDVAILENGDKIRGIGEPGTPPAAPALANAIFAATGQRIRELPMNKQVRFVS